MSLSSEIWKNTPRDILFRILADPSIPIDVRVHFRKEFGIATHKLRPSPELFSKLTSIIQRRTPRPEMFGDGMQVFNTSDAPGTFPPHEIITLTVHTPGPTVLAMVPERDVSQISYNIYVRKKKCYSVYGYMLLNNEWYRTYNRFPLPQNL
jgi:hypothetical protein